MGVGLYALQPMVQTRRLAISSVRAAEACGLGVALSGLYDRKSASACARRSKKASPRGQAIGKSRGGPTTKIHLACDGRGRPIHFRLSPGNRNDFAEAPDLIDGLPGTGHWIVADKGYDSALIRGELRSRGSIPVIPWRRDNKHPGRYRKSIYRRRHRIENAFCRLKHYRGIATRYEKLARNFAGMVSMACILHWLAF